MLFPTLKGVSVRDPDLEKVYVSMKNSHSAAISDGTWCALDSSQTGEARAYSVVPAASGDHWLTVGVAQDNKGKSIPVGDYGLIQAYGYADDCVADANGWSAAGQLLVINSSGQANNASSTLNKTTSAHEVGELIGHPVAQADNPPVGGVADVFVLRL